MVDVLAVSLGARQSGQEHVLNLLLGRVGGDRIAVSAMYLKRLPSPRRLPRLLQD